MSDPSGFYSWGQNQLSVSLLIEASAELETGDLFRLSQANIARTRIWITDKGEWKGCPRLNLPEINPEIRKHF